MTAAATNSFNGTSIESISEPGSGTVNARNASANQSRRVGAGPSKASAMPGTMSNCEPTSSWNSCCERPSAYSAAPAAIAIQPTMEPTGVRRCMRKTPRERQSSHSQIATTTMPGAPFSRAQYTASRSR